MNILYKIGNPFEDKNNTLVNFISADWVFRKDNINNLFATRYNSLEYLNAMQKDKKNKKGIALYHRSNKINIFHLTVKDLYWHNLSIELLNKSLIDLKNQIIELELNNVVFLRQNNYLEELEWKKVEEIIEKIFKEIDINIIIYSY